MPQEDALSSQQEQCSSTAEAPALTYTQCADCMADIYTTNYASNLWACGSQICQNAALWDEEYVAEGNCTAYLEQYTPKQMQACLSGVPAEYTFLGAEDVLGARAKCFECIDMSKNVGLQQEGSEGFF